MDISKKETEDIQLLIADINAQREVAIQYIDAEYAAYFETYELNAKTRASSLNLQLQYGKNNYVSGVVKRIDFKTDELIIIEKPGNTEVSVSMINVYAIDGREFSRRALKADYSKLTASVFDPKTGIDQETKAPPPIDAPPKTGTDAQPFTSPPKLVYALTNQPNDTLPDMTGFEQDNVGTAAHGWTSPSVIRADRDLDIGEKLFAWLVRLVDGSLVETIEFTATAANKGKAAWPIAFANEINKKGSKLKAGHMDTSGVFSTSDGQPRLWHYSNAYRAFTTAAVKNNWVEGLALPDHPLQADTQLRLEVRDISTQALHEHFIFTPDPKRLNTVDWQMDLMSQFDRECRFTKTGIQNADGKIAAAASGNALWIPQVSEIAVTLTPTTWTTRLQVTPSRDLNDDEELRTQVWDEYSNTLGGAD
ncbi:hypothetical protein, partial [Pseudomonas cannabina]